MCPISVGEIGGGGGGGGGGTQAPAPAYSALPFIGPVACRIRNAAMTFISAPDAHGIRECTIGGIIQWTSAHQLGELVDNPDRAVTVGDHVGVLEHLVFPDDLLGPLTGWYLLQSFEFDPAQQWSGHGLDYPVAFSLRAAYLGEHREVVVVRSARARSNDFALTAVAVAADPFASPSGFDDSLLASVARVRYREYDPRAYAPTLAPLSPYAQKLLYLTNLGGGTDWLTIVPVPRRYDAALPVWASQRGGDCRAYDKTEAREVYGPSHPVLDPTDLLVTNGLLRVTVGARGDTPAVSVAVMKSGTWNAAGTVAFAAAGSAILMGARLVRCTPEIATIALTVTTFGTVFVSLRRGERMLRVQHGSDLPPLVTTPRTIAWVGATAGASSGGRRVESAPDALGFSRVLMALHAVTDGTGFAITSGSVSRWDVGAALATSAVDDDPPAQHAQFAAEVHQQTRVR